MIDLEDVERAYLVEMRALTTDQNGHEVFVGLTPEETAFYISYSKRAQIGETNPEETDSYLELHERHEAARQSVIYAEVELRADNPPRH